MAETYGEFLRYVEELYKGSPPGTPEAVRDGCNCEKQEHEYPAIDNEYFIMSDCPLHGHLIKPKEVIDG